MKYPFLTLDDNTEIVHSEILPDGKVQVYVEKPDENKYQEIIESTAHLILSI